MLQFFDDRVTTGRKVSQHNWFESHSSQHKFQAIACDRIMPIHDEDSFIRPCAARHDFSHSCTLGFPWFIRLYRLRKFGLFALALNVACRICNEDFTACTLELASALNLLLSEVNLTLSKEIPQFVCRHALPPPVANKCY